MWLRPDVVRRYPSNLSVRTDTIRGKSAAGLALAQIRKGFDSGELQLNDKEVMCLSNSPNRGGLARRRQTLIGTMTAACDPAILRKYDRSAKLYNKSRPPLA